MLLPQNSRSMSFLLPAVELLGPERRQEGVILIHVNLMKMNHSSTKPSSLFIWKLQKEMTWLLLQHLRLNEFQNF